MSDPRFSIENFFSYGFRPFFLFAYLFAAFSMTAWLAWVGLHAMKAQVLRPTIVVPPHEWHAHEMLFGYALAAIAGFLLTAVPNWTNSKPVSGGALMLLVSSWLAGRMAIWFSAYLPTLMVAVFDLAFIPMLLAFVAKALLRRWAPRNFIFIPILSLLLAANIMTHVEWAGLLDAGPELTNRLAINAVVLLVTIIGGRVVPAFTTNVLRRESHILLPTSRKPLEIFSILSMVAVLIVEALGFDGWLAGTVAIVAALAHAVRLAGWRGLQTLGKPILWVLHLGYAWLVAGLAFKAAAHFALMSEATAIHALTIGAVGTITMAVMTRASLGHTGRTLRVSNPITLAYLLISASAVVRIVVPALLPAYYNEGVVIAGVLWVLAYVIVSVVFWPILTLPRIISTFSPATRCVREREQQPTSKTRSQIASTPRKV